MENVKKGTQHAIITDLGSLIRNSQYENVRNFSATQVLREIKFGHFEAPKIAIYIISAALNLEFLGIFDIFQYKVFPKSL